MRSPHAPISFSRLEVDKASINLTYIAMLSAYVVSSSHMTFKVGFQRISLTFTVQRYLPRPLFHISEIIVSQPAYVTWCTEHGHPPPYLSFTLDHIFPWIPTRPEHSLNTNTSPILDSNPRVRLLSPTIYQTLKQAPLPAVIFGCPMGVPRVPLSPRVGYISPWILSPCPLRCPHGYRYWRELSPWGHQAPPRGPYLCTLCVSVQNKAKSEGPQPCPGLMAIWNHVCRNVPVSWAIWWLGVDTQMSVIWAIWWLGFDTQMSVIWVIWWLGFDTQRSNHFDRSR